MIHPPLPEPERPPYPLPGPDARRCLAIMDRLPPGYDDPAVAYAAAALPTLRAADVLDALRAYAERTAA